jgi:hypothetical protein
MGDERHYDYRAVCAYSESRLRGEYLLYDLIEGTDEMWRSALPSEIERFTDGAATPGQRRFASRLSRMMRDDIDVIRDSLASVYGFTEDEIRTQPRLRRLLDDFAKDRIAIRAIRNQILARDGDELAARFAWKDGRHSRDTVAEVIGGHFLLLNEPKGATSRIAAILNADVPTGNKKWLMTYDHVANALDRFSLSITRHPRMMLPGATNMERLIICARYLAIKARWRGELWCRARRHVAQPLSPACILELYDSGLLFEWLDEIERGDSAVVLPPLAAVLALLKRAARVRGENHKRKVRHAQRDAVRIGAR